MSGLTDQTGHFEKEIKLRFSSKFLPIPITAVCLSSCVARQPLCYKVNLPRCEVNLLSCVARRPLCHKVNLPRWEAPRRHLMMTCDIFGTGQTNTLTLYYLLGKTYKPPHSSATLESLKSTRST